MQKLAGSLATELGALDPPHAADYTARAQSFATRIGELQAKAQAIGGAHPGTRVAVTEPVPGYLIETAGLTDATPPEFSEAIEEDTDPPAAVLARTLALFGSDPVRALIVNAQTETPTTDQVVQAAQTGGVPIVEVTETLPAGVTDYLSWMNGQIDALTAAVDQS
jgi:zinc/manganese transport system substrate-binding protein